MSTAPMYFEAQSQDNRGTSFLAILGLILGIIPCTFLLGLLFSLIGIAVTGPSGKKGRAVAVTGLVFSLVWAAGAGSIGYGLYQCNQQITVAVNKMASGEAGVFYKQLPLETRNKITEEQFTGRLKELLKPYGLLQGIKWLSFKTTASAVGNEHETAVSVDLVFANKTVPFVLHAKEVQGIKQTVQVTFDGKDLADVLGFPVQDLFGPQTIPAENVKQLPSSQPTTAP